MWLPLHLHGIPRFHFISRWSYDGSRKIQVIQDWPEPHKVQDIQSFLGFANFYQWFIYNYSNIIIPLTHLTWKGTLWHFSDDCWSAFTAIKKAFTCALVITHWVLDAQITVEMDASDYAVAAILSITLSNGDIHPIAFYSWTLTTWTRTFPPPLKQTPDPSGTLRSSPLSSVT